MRLPSATQLGDGSGENAPLFEEATKLIEKVQQLNKTRNAFIHAAVSTCHPPHNGYVLASL